MSQDFPCWLALEHVYLLGADVVNASADQCSYEGFRAELSLLALRTDDSPCWQR